MLAPLQNALFPHDGEKTYVIVDGASCEELLEHLDKFEPRYFCLYAGELEPDVEEVAPYLIELLLGHPFTDWFLENCFDQHWGIFARSRIGLRAIRKHFRSFLLVKSPDNVPLYFRYYDPRVLPLYLSSATPGELKTFFGEVSSYLCETDEGDFAAFQVTSSQLVRRSVFRLAEKAQGAS